MESVKILKKQKKVGNNMTKKEFKSIKSAIEHLLNYFEKNCIY